VLRQLFHIHFFLLCPPLNRKYAPISEALGYSSIKAEIAEEILKAYFTQKFKLPSCPSEPIRLLFILRTQLTLQKVNKYIGKLIHMNWAV